MTKEFEPIKLTTSAENSYAGSMVEPGSPENIDGVDAAGTPTPDGAPPVRPDAQASSTQESPLSQQQENNIAKKVVEDLLQRAQRESLESTERDIELGTNDPQMMAEIQRMLLENPPQGRRALFEEDFAQLQNPNITPGAKVIAFKNIQDMAKILTKKGGVVDPAIKDLADAQMDGLSESTMRNLVQRANLNNNFSQQLDRVSNGLMAQRNVSYGSPEYNEQLLKQYYPPSLEDVGERIMENEEDKYRTGGKFEIMGYNEDGEIELKPWHMRRWMKEKWLKWGHQLNPDTPDSSPFNTVAIQSLYTQLDLLRLLTNTNFWKHRVKVYEPGTKNQKINPDTGELEWRYEDSSAYQNLRNELLNAFWLFGKAHTFDATIRPQKGNEKEFFQTAQGLYNQQVWLQARDRIMVAWREDATSGDDATLRQEYEEWMNVPGTGGPLKEGRAGRAHRLADALYFRIGHLEKWNTESGKEKISYLTRQKDNYNYSDNKFYELLGKEGVRAFYTSMVNRGLAGMKSVDRQFFSTLDKAELEGVNMAELMFRNDRRSMEELLTRNGNRDALQKALGENVDIATFVTRALETREKVLQQLTGKDNQEGGDGRMLDGKGIVGFRDNKYVRSLFNNAGAGSPLALEELGLRFIDRKVGGAGKKPQAEAWESEKTRKDAWKNTRKELNIFNSSSKPAEFDRAVRFAVQDAVGKLNGLDDLDAEYAENFAFAKVYFTFTSGYNDTTGTGFDAGTKLARFAAYRENNETGGKNQIGDLQNMKGIKRLLLTLWEAGYGTIENADGSKKKVSLLSVMENGFTDTSRGKQLQTVDFDRGQEKTIGDNHIASAFGLYSRIKDKHSINFEKIIKIDHFRRVQVDKEALDDIFSGWNKDIRYTYNQINLNFEDIAEDIEVTWVKDETTGKMKSEPVFVKQKLKDRLFNNEIVNMGMYERRIFKDNWVNKRIGEKDANGEDMLSEYSRNVLAWLIAKEILEHRLMGDKDSIIHSRIWNLDMIKAIEGAFLMHPLGEIEEKSIGLFNKNKKLSRTDSFFNSKEFRKIRLMGNASYLKLYGEDIRAQMAESAWKGGTGTTKKFFSYIFQDFWK